MSVLEALAEALVYPGADYTERLGRAARAAAGVEPAAGRRLTRLTARLAGLSPGETEELFCRTFDLNPACALEVGWHLYGEDYKRGAFLVRLRNLLVARGIAEQGELADHLIHVLPLLARLEAADAGELARDFVLPAVERMAASLRDKDNPYEDLLEAVLAVLRTLFAAEEAVRP